MLWPRMIFLLRDRAIHRPEGAAGGALEPVLALLSEAAAAPENRAHGGHAGVFALRPETLPGQGEECVGLLALSSVCNSLAFSSGGRAPRRAQANGRDMGIVPAVTVRNGVAVKGGSPGRLTGGVASPATWSALRQSVRELLGPLEAFMDGVLGSLSSSS
ncbi:unnamed protein product, partial [Discosporangium mesarthrocarpum]